MGIPSRELKHKLFVDAVVVGGQTVKIVTHNDKLPEWHGIPPSVLAQFSDGVPLDINPRYPLELDHDAEGLSATMGFRGIVSRCTIPWDAVAVMAIGIGGVDWEYEVLEEKPETVTTAVEPLEGTNVLKGPWGGG